MSIADEIHHGVLPMVFAEGRGKVAALAANTRSSTI